MPISRNLRKLARRLLTLSRRLGLAKSPSAMAQRVIGDGLTYLAPEKLIRIEGALAKVAKRNVPGDYVELGIAAGGSAILIGSAAQANCARFCGFDAFGQIPPPTSKFDDENSRDRYEVIASGRAHGLGGNEYYGYVEDLYKQVEDNFRLYGLNLEPGEIELHKGLFEETLSEAKIDAIAFAHVDCDWYDPVKHCLEFVSQRLADGGFIVIDDYHDYGGCKKATDEFLQTNRQFRMLRGRNPFLVRG